jgi:mRNA export factor
MVVTGSWDKRIKYWDLRTDSAVVTVDCNERVYSLDVARDLLIVATASQHVLVIDLKNPGTIRESRKLDHLNSQIRAVACSSDAKTFIIGAMEGRAYHQIVDPPKSS